MPNRYKLPDGKLIDVQAKHLNDFLRKNPNAKIVYRGVSTWKKPNGAYINVENNDLEKFFQQNPQVELISGNTQLQKWEKKTKLAARGIKKENASFFANPYDWFFIDPDETQEKNTWLEASLGKNQIFDFFGDRWRDLKRGYVQGTNITELGLIGQLADGEQISEEDQEKIFEAMQELNNVGQSDEMLEYMASLKPSGNQAWDMMTAIGGITTRPGLMLETFLTSMTGAVVGLTEKEGLAWGGANALIGAGIGATTALVAGQMGPQVATPEELITVPIGAAVGGFGGLISGVGGSIEMAGKINESIQKAVLEKYDEYNYENFQKLLKEHPDAVVDIYNDAYTKGMTISLVDTFFSAIAPGISKIATMSAVKGGTELARVLSKPLVRTGIIGLTEGTGGAFGEYLSEEVIGGQASGAELALEATGGGPMTAFSMVKTLANPGVYEINGDAVTRNQMWQYLSNPKVDDIDIVKTVKVQNDPALEGEYRARLKSVKFLATLPKDKDGNDLISLEDKKRLLNLETKLEEAENKKSKLVEVDGKLIKVKDLKSKIEEIYSKYEGKTSADLGVGTVKKAVDIRRDVMKDEKETESAQEEAGLRYDAFDFSEEFEDAYFEKWLTDYAGKNNIDISGLSETEILKLRKQAVKNLGGGEGVRFGDGTILVDRQRALEVEAYDSVNSHEFLHNVVDDRFEALDIDKKITLLNDFKKILKSKLKGKFYNAIVKRLKENDQDLDTSTEWFTYFSDVVKQNKGLKNLEKKGLFDTLISFFNKNVNEHTDYKNLDFENAENMYEWLKTYSTDIKQRKKLKVKVTGDKEVVFSRTKSVVKKDRTPAQATKEINDLGKQIVDKDGTITNLEKEGEGNFYFKAEAKNIYKKIQEQGLLDNLILKQPHVGINDKTFLDTTYAELFSWFKKYQPERQNPSGLFGHINPQIPNRAKQAYNSITKGQVTAPTVDIGQTTKEGEVKIQVAAETDASTKALETEDLSPAAQARKRAEAAKPKVQKTSKLRKTLGIETGGEIYNRILDTARKVLIRAYDAGKSVRNIQIALKKEANTYIFKQIKNMLGVGAKYIPNITQLREAIVESMFTSDLVQMERNIPDNEKVFVKFVRKLTKVEDVEAAVDQNLLPPSDINRIKKGQAVNLYKKVMPTEEQFVSFFDQPLINPKTGARSGLKGTRKDQLTTYLSNSLTLDAIMQVAQETEVVEKRTQIAELKGETLVEQDLQILSETVNRPVDVKFSKRFNKKNINDAVSHIIEEEGTIGWWKKVIDIYKKEGNFSYRLAIKEIINSNSYSIKQIYKIPEVRKYLKDQRDFENKNKLKPEKNSYYLELLAINNFVNAAKELGVNVILTEVAEGANPDVTLEKDGIQFGIEIKADKARGPRIQFYLDIKNIIKGVYNMANEKSWMRNSEKGKGKEKGYKETLDKLVAETVPGLKKIQKLLQEKYNVTNFVLSTPGKKKGEKRQEQTLISEEAYNEIKRLNYDTDVASFLIVDSDFVGLQYLTKKIPSYYINLGDAGAKLISNFDPLKMEGKVDNFGGVPIPLAIRLVGVKSAGGVRLTLVAEAQLDSRSFKKEDVNMFKSEDVKTKIASFSKSSVNINRGNILSKVIENARTTVKYSKTSKGMSTFDFDETLIDKGKNFIIAKKGNETIKISSGEWPIQGPSLAEQGYSFDFNDFVNVRGGIEGPLLQKMRNQIKKYGPKNVFVLTARPAESETAIHGWLKSKNINIPVKNITGLGNSTGEAKAMWMLEKFAEGYNDMYFVDDALSNVKAVKNVLNQLDIKSNVQQVKVKFSKSMNTKFNKILEQISGIEAKKRFSDAKARKRGRGKGRFRFFVPPSHEDFVGLLYNFMGKGELGNQHRNFFETALLRPLNRAFRELNQAKQAIANDYRSLIKAMPEVRKRLGEKILGGDYVIEDAIRVYLWDKAGFDIPGLTKTDRKKLVEIIKSDSVLRSFADTVGIISRTDEGYITPGDSWEVGNIKYDLVDATGRVGRKKFFAEFIENADIIFSPENINKIRAAFGDNFVEALQDMLYAVKTGTNRPSGKNKQVNTWLDWINGSVGATMFVNVRSALLQQLSFVNFVNFADNNIFKAAARFANQAQFWKDFAFIFNSDFLKQRRSGAAFDVNANEIAREVAGSRSPVRAAIKSILNLGFLPTQMGDSFAISLGGASFLRNRINTYLKQGLSQKEAESKAWNDFTEIAEATQQSARPDMVSMQQRSPLGRLVLAFQNVSSQYVRLIKKSGLDLAKRRISKGYTTQAQSDAANVSKIIYYGAAQGVIFYGLQTAMFAMMFDDDERDEKFFEKKKDRVVNGLLDNILKGSGVAGSVVATLKNYVWKLVDNQQSDSWFKSPAWEELIQLSPPLGIKFRKLKSAERTLDWNKDVMKEIPLFTLDNPIWKLSTAWVEGFTNIPLNRLHNKAQNISAGLDSENAWWQRIAVVAGWSTWDVGIENKTIKEAKERVKENKKQINKQTKLRKKYPNKTDKQIKILEVEKSVYDLNKREQERILKQNGKNPKKYKLEKDRVKAIMKLRSKNPKKIDDQVSKIKNFVPNKQEKREINLFKMNKKEQVNILMNYGLSSKEIKKLKYEEDRVKKIIQLEKKRKSKK